MTDFGMSIFLDKDNNWTYEVSKDNSVAPKKGTFLEVFKEDKIYDIQTGEEVSAEDIFGKTFFELCSIFDVTFKSNDKTCYGNCKAEKMLYITTRGMDIQDIKSLLGHANIETTMEYVCIDSSKVSASYRQHIA